MESGRDIFCSVPPMISSKSSEESKEFGYAVDKNVNNQTTGKWAISRMNSRSLTSPKGQLASFDIFKSHPFPVQKITQSLSTVPLIDTLATTLACEIEDIVG